jgi:hypothetical protein
MVRLVHKVLFTAMVLLALSTASQGAIIFGPNGLGGFNAYERVDNQVNFATAITNSQVAFPFASAFNVPAVVGHMANFSSSADYEFLAVTMRTAAPQNVYIGLTDSPALLAGAIEGGNTSGGALPSNGVVALAGQRGFGWAQVGTGLQNTFHQRTPGVSIWGGGEPNGGAGESAAEVRGDGFLNDINEGNTRPFVREWDLNLANIPTIATTTPGFKITDIRNVGAVNNGNYKALAAAPPVGSVSFLSIDPFLNYGSNAGEFRSNNGFTDLSFPMGGGDNFLIIAEGFIKIPVAGAYTLQMNQDDAIQITIGTNGAPVVFEDQGCCDTTFATVNLDAGIFPIKVIFAEFGGGEHLEFSMAFGAGVTNLSQFRLVGDVANGGLEVFAAIIPEPATAALGLMSLSLLALRRRRAA